MNANLRSAIIAIAGALFPCISVAQIIYIDDSGKKTEVSKEVYSKQGVPQKKLNRVNVGDVRLDKGLFADRYALNRDYVMSLDNFKLLQNFYNEAASPKTRDVMVNKDGSLEHSYWGWESPNCQLRGHFLGHWLSAAAYMYAETGDLSILQKANDIVNELAECQKLNGNGWVGSIPEKYLTAMTQGVDVWSPQYTLHKTLMGLYDMYKITGSQQALSVLGQAADWFWRWTNQLIESGQESAIYGGETAGMLEIWAAMYGETGDQKYSDLMQRYGEPSIFAELLNGEDALSCNHANASIPWSHGAAKAYETTGNEYWRNLVQEFWNQAVEERESFCTGGQNAGEHWIPKGQLANFVGENNQEHCTVYNMMRTADYLLRWTGDVKYADYIERNLYNGILAQQHPYTGMVAYFLPMEQGCHKGGEKGWGHPTMDFYCCHGSLVQAHTRYLEYIYYDAPNELTICQYIPSEFKWNNSGKEVRVSQTFAAYDWDKAYDESRWRMRITVDGDTSDVFSLRLRIPWWVDKSPIILVNGEEAKANIKDGFAAIDRTWNPGDVVYLEFPRRLYTEPLPGATNAVAFMDGPIVLAAKTDNNLSLNVPNAKGDIASQVLAPEYNQEYKTIRWTQSHYKTKNQPTNVHFVPLYEISDELYQIYFPLQ